MPDTSARPGSDRPSLLFDVAVAALTSGISLSIFVSLTQRPSTDRSAVALTAVLLVIHNGALALRRFYPLAVLAVAIGSGLAVLALGWPTAVLGLALVVAVYTAGAELRRRLSIAALGGALLALGVGALLTDRGPDLSTHVANAGVLATAWFIGSTMRARREYATNLERRNTELEAARDELARRAVAEERVRIARELHDVIAHNMSVIAVQAGAGRRIIDQDPSEAKRSLGIIEETSRSALAETRRVLGLLREQEETGSLRPTPTLGELDGLLKRVQGAGFDMQLHRSDDLDDLSPGLQLAIYRIVQEALTNVMKHSGARRGRVVISRSNGNVEVEVVDDGAGSRRKDGDGAGLRGMRERVDAYGGRLDARDLPEGGFRVSASLPIGGDA